MSSTLYSATPKLCFMSNDLAKRINLLMQKTGASRADLARVAKVSPTASGQWASGEIKEMAAKHAFLLADHYGCKARWLSTGVGPAWPSHATAVAEEKAAYTPVKKSPAIAKLEHLMNIGRVSEADLELMVTLVDKLQLRGAAQHEGG